MSVTDPHIRKRDLEIVKPGTSYSQLWVNGSSNGPQPFQTGIVGNETTVSRKGVNWLAYQRLKEKSRKSGHPLRNGKLLSTADLGTSGFESIKKYVEHGRLPDVNVNTSSGIYSYTYSGPWVAKSANVGNNSSLYPAVPGDLSERMRQRGTTAIARTIPTNPVANAAQFLGELREGLPAVPGSRSFKRRDVSSPGDEYLNLEFGLKPFMSDLQKFAEAARTSDEVIKQLKRDSGRLIRRRYDFPVEETVSEPVVESTQWYGAPGLRLAAPNAYSQYPGKLTRIRTETYRYWFSGAYTYLYIDGDRAVDKMGAAAQRFAKLWGLRISPELLWELTPWSWAADWVGNTGEVIHNLSAFSNDNLVLRWGYIMCHYTCRDTYLAEGVSLKGNASGPLSQTFVTDVKKRLKATPYGFGLDPDVDFSARQWAILGALGISRGTKLL